MPKRRDRWSYYLINVLLSRLLAKMVYAQKISTLIKNNKVKTAKATDGTQALIRNYRWILRKTLFQRRLCDSGQRINHHPGPYHRNRRPYRLNQDDRRNAGWPRSRWNCQAGRILEKTLRRIWSLEFSDEKQNRWFLKRPTNRLIENIELTVGKVEFMHGGNSRHIGYDKNLGICISPHVAA